jgi:hypothetical protein
LLSKLSIHKYDEKWLSIILTDYEHLDYIDDVLAEHFDIICNCVTIDDENQKYIMYFGTEISFDELSLLVDKINAYHEEHSKLYDTV